MNHWILLAIGIALVGAALYGAYWLYHQITGVAGAVGAPASSATATTTTSTPTTRTRNVFFGARAGTN